MYVKTFRLYELTLVLRRGVATTPETVFAPVLKNAQPGDKISPVPLSSPFPLILGKNFRTYYLTWGAG